MIRKEEIILNFADPSVVNGWYSINDRVMGGVSQSKLQVTDSETAVFVGDVSLENSGGFASVRSPQLGLDLSDYEGVLVRVRGDGKRYVLRLRNSDGWDDINYDAIFDTVPDQWMIIEINFRDFQPTYRGEIISQAPELDLSQVETIGFLISGRQTGNFRLELDWLKCYSRSSH